MGSVIMLPDVSTPHTTPGAYCHSNKVCTWSNIRSQEAERHQTQTRHCRVTRRSPAISAHHQEGPAQPTGRAWAGTWSAKHAATPSFHRCEPTQIPAGHLDTL